MVSAELFSAPHSPQSLMAFFIDEKRMTSPISSTQVSAEIGPTGGMVIRRSTRERQPYGAGEPPTPEKFKIPPNERDEVFDLFVRYKNDVVKNHQK